MRLIDADELLLKMAIFYDFSNPETEIGLSKRKGLSLVRNIIQNKDITPTVDAVEVVRCKDCKYSARGAEFGTIICRVAERKIKPDDYCSYGERREEE